MLSCVFVVLENFKVSDIRVLITCILILLAEVLSVYVKNVPSTALASQIEEDFKKFGKIRPDGVAIRTRKVGSFNILHNTSFEH